MLFTYNPTGIAALMAFTGNDFTAVHKPREMGAKAVATVAGLAVTEGSYLIRANHDYRVMGKAQFEAMYEAVTEQATAIVATQVSTAQVSAALVPTKQPKPGKVVHKSIQAAMRAATAAGTTMFTYHQPCQSGHRGPRYTHNGACVSCTAEHSRRYRVQRQRQAQSAQA